MTGLDPAQRAHGRLLSGGCQGDLNKVGDHGTSNPFFFLIDYSHPAPEAMRMGDPPSID